MSLLTIIAAVSVMGRQVSKSADVRVSVVVRVWREEGVVEIGVENITALVRFVSTVSV